MTSRSSLKDLVLYANQPSIHRNPFEAPFEDHLLRNPKTMIFIDEPYRNAVKMAQEKIGSI